MKRCFSIVACMLAGSVAFAQVKMTEEEQAARQVKPADNMALVYVIRSSEYGGINEMTVLLNRDTMGVTYGRNYLYTIVKPGKYLVSSVSENTATMELNVEAGKTYYVKQHVKMGVMSARSRLLTVDETEGRKIMEKAKLAADNRHTRIKPEP